MAGQHGSDNGFWSAVAAVGAVVITQLAAAWMFIRGRRGDEQKAVRELELRSGEQEFEHEIKLRDRIDKLEEERAGDRAALWDLRQKVLELTGQLNATLETNALLQRQNEDAKRKSEELSREYTAQQIITDKHISDLRSDLLQVHEERRLLLIEVTELRRQVNEGH